VTTSPRPAKLAPAEDQNLHQTTNQKAGLAKKKKKKKKENQIGRAHV
jgi:hypothetical protein